VIDTISNLLTFGQTVLGFLIVITIIVFVHEMGHYLVGRWCGIKAEVFSLGFGKVLFARNDKRGTRWQIAAVPLGGYVRFLGDADAASVTQDAAAMAGPDRDQSFPAASAWRRALTIAAGPVANFILAILVFAGVAYWSGVSTEKPEVGALVDLPYETSLEVGDLFVELNGKPVLDYDTLFEIVREMDPEGPMQAVVQRNGAPVSLEIPYLLLPLVSGVALESPAEAAGIQAGDLILAVDGEPVSYFSDLKRIVSQQDGISLALTIWRDGQEITLYMAPEMTERLNGDGTVSKDVLIGVAGDYYFTGAVRYPGIGEALSFGAYNVQYHLKTTINGISAIIRGALSPKVLSGPVGIAKATGDIVKRGTTSMILWLAVLSAGIGFVNLLPIPVLDGGHLVLLAVEAIRRKPASPRVLQLVMSIGLVFVLFMFVFVTYNDIMRLI
jgi:regulator of sigma E protease